MHVRRLLVLCFLGREAFDSVEATRSQRWLLSCCCGVSGRDRPCFAMGNLVHILFLGAGEGARAWGWKRNLEFSEGQARFWKGKECVDHVLTEGVRAVQGRELKGLRTPLVMMGRKKRLTQYGETDCRISLPSNPPPPPSPPPPWPVCTVDEVWRA